MGYEYEQNLIPNAIGMFAKHFNEGIILKPIYSRSILVQVSKKPDRPNDEEWIENVDLLLQYGVDVCLSQNHVPDEVIEGYSLVFKCEDLDTHVIKKLISDQNLEPLDGSTR